MPRAHATTSDPTGWRTAPLELARWMVAGVVLAVAWPFGMLRTEHQEILAMVVMWLWVFAVGGWALCRRLPQVPVAFITLGAGLLLYGWGLLCFPRGVYDPELLLLTPIPRKVPDWWGGTVDAASTRSKMLLVSSYIMLFLVAGDAASSRVWRGRLAGTVAVAAGGVAAFGLYQKAAGATNIYWLPGPPENPTFFGPFRYHGNAAAFLVAGLPLALGLTFLALRRPVSGALKALWCLVSLTIVTALMVNTSRAGVWLTIGVVLVSGIREASRLWHGQNALLRTQLVIFLLTAAGAIYLLGTAFGWEKALGRSTAASVTAGLEERSLAPYDALPAAADAGWWGFGPGSFRAIFPYYRPGVDPKATVRTWEHLHNDPLQTVIEWGWVGASGWVLLLALLSRHGWKRVVSAKPTSGRRAVLEGAGLGFLAVFLHSMVDFPFQIPAIAVMLSVAAGILASQPVAALGPAAKEDSARSPSHGGG